MNWDIRVARSAEKQLKRFPQHEVVRIEEIINSMEINPFSGDIAKLSGQEYAWRRRSGSYRILYELHIDEKIIYIFDIKRRTSKTY